MRTKHCAPAHARESANSVTKKSFSECPPPDQAHRREPTARYVSRHRVHRARRLQTGAGRSQGLRPQQFALVRSVLHAGRKRCKRDAGTVAWTLPADNDIIRKTPAVRTLPTASASRRRDIRARSCHRYWKCAPEALAIAWHRPCRQASGTTPSTGRSRRSMPRSSTGAAPAPATITTPARNRANALSAENFTPAVIRDTSSCLQKRALVPRATNRHQQRAQQEPVTAPRHVNVSLLR